MTPDQSNMCLMAWQPGTDYTKLYKEFQRPTHSVRDFYGPICRLSQMEGW